MHEKEFARLKDTLQQFNSDTPPGIFLTEVLEPGDARENSPEFVLAKAKEPDGLICQGAFEIVLRDEISKQANILGSRFVLTIKEKGTNKEIFKARYVVQGHKDAEKDKFRSFFFKLKTVFY